MLKKVDTSGLTLNISHEELIKNVETNIRSGLPQAQVHPINNQKVCLVGGGPSLNSTFGELRDCYFHGDKIIAMNGAANFLMGKNIRPSMVVVIDARAFNVRFVEDPIPNCKYFVASQCHPSIVDAVKDRDSYLFHMVYDEDMKALLDRFYFGEYFNVTGGTTVMLRTIWLARMLGFVRQEVFGFDSCCRPPDEGGAHHAYLQAENDGDIIHKDQCAGKTFWCTNWQRKQAEDFREFITHHGSHFLLNVHGDGLIAHMLKTGARLQENRSGTQE